MILTDTKCFWHLVAYSYCFWTLKIISYFLFSCQLPKKCNFLCLSKNVILSYLSYSKQLFAGAGEGLRNLRSLNTTFCGSAKVDTAFIR